MSKDEEYDGKIEVDLSAVLAAIDQQLEASFGWGTGVDDITCYLRQQIARGAVALVLKHPSCRRLK